ncbi:MAG TPA: class I SAM-dependent methyltransferase [Magnetospirillaceae bacterium]|jgi:SAM-dependent methyltransferase
MNAGRFRTRNTVMAAHYSSLAKRHGDSPKAAQWRGASSQERRWDILFEIDDLTHAKILDFGCGTGAMLASLRRRCDYDGEYVGCDISEGMLKIAKGKFPGVRFETLDIFADAPIEMFDYVFASGTFNNDHADAYDFIMAAIPRLFARARKGLAFNLLSSDAPRRVAELIYVSPLEVFDFCRADITPLVTLRNDYRIEDEEIPEDFTIYLRRG